MDKTFKDYCKDAKKRLKTGYWENYNRELRNKIDQAEKNGVSQNAVREYFSIKAKQEIKTVVSDQDDDFYNRVKKLLTEEGEVYNAIGRLTDKEVFDSLSYEEKQRYTMSLAEKYLKAVERYKKEVEVEGKL